MNGKTFPKVLVMILCFMLIVGTVPMTAFAAETEFVSETHDVFKSTKSTIAPGVTQSINYAYAKDGKQMVYYVATADITRDDVVVQTSYFKQHENGAMGMNKVTEQMAYAKEKYSNPEDEHFISEYYTPVVGVNASFYNMSTGQPSGTTYIDGVSFGTTSYDNFFAILKDGTAVIDYRQNIANYTDEKSIQHAVAGSQWLVRDGKDVTANITGDYNVDRHSRTCVGVTEDGKVVMMVLDGRQEPYSCGGSMHELAQIMLEAGCVAAINLDGGGSTTYVARQEGDTAVSVVNRPSDGSERAISAGLMIASTTEPTDIFDHVNLTAEHDYVTPESSVKISAVGISTTNGPAVIPEGATLQLEDSKYGKIEDGTFVSNGTVGDVVVEMIVDGQVVGETTIHVVIPDLEFEYKSMTASYNKTFKLKVKGTTNNGKNKVVIKDSDLKFELSDPKMGEIKGTSYTTCDASTGLTGGTITVKCVYDESKSDTAQVLFGKASEIVEDFEDKNTDGWATKSAYARAGKGDLTYGRFESSEINLVDSKTGRVRNGEYALELVADFSTTTASGYKAIKYTFPAIDLTGATTFGMWMYLPVEDVHNLEFDIGGYEYHIEDDANVGDEGWYYITAPAKTVGGTVDTFTIYMTDPDENYFNIFNTFKIYIDDLTVDYSNATEDREIPYFTKVGVVTGLDQTTEMTGQTIKDNTITVIANATENMDGNYTGLNTEAASVYVDGKKLNDNQFDCDEKGQITVPDITLSNGTHSFRFEIEDNNGNVGFATRKIVINEENGNVTLVRRSDNALPLAGSIDYYDITAKAIESVDSVTMEIDLDTLNAWELEGADVAYGFDMDYRIDNRSNTAAIKLTKVGECDVQGEAVIASLPVRVWQTTSYLQKKYIDAGVVSNSTSSNESVVVSTPYVMWQTDRTRLVRIEMDVVGATVNYADGTTETFATKDMNVITELNRYRSAGYYDENGKYLTGDTTFIKQGKEHTHLHDVKAIADKAATCTETGYENRTFCEGCKSVIDWGTIKKATGHTYELVDGVLKCECDKVFNGTWEDGKVYIDGIAGDKRWIGDSYYIAGEKVKGIKLIDGYYYDFGESGICEGKVKYTGLFKDGDIYRYAKIGELAKGWIDIEGDWYFFNSDYEAANGILTGKQTSSTTTYNFEYEFNNGKLVEGVWVKTGSGTRYYYGPSYYKASNVSSVKWFDVNGVTYGADTNGNRYEGICAITEANEKIPTAYVFSDNGRLEGLFSGTGLAKYFTGKYFYYVNGELNHAGLIYLDGYYYYIDSSCKAVTGTKTVVAGWTNDLLPSGIYEFDEEGRMLNPPAPKNGLVEENGRLYYYVDGELNHAGLIYIDGYYYYVDSSCRAVTGTKSIGAAWTNGLLPYGTYEFGKDGKMLNPPAPKNGLVEENGKLYYYIDGELNHAGLICVDGYYYYIDGSCKAVTGKKLITAMWTNGLLPYGIYEFGEDGKMLNPPAPRNGLVEENGRLYYYVNGELNHAGLICVDGYYYYIDSSCKAVVGTKTISPTWTNGLLPYGTYEFGEDGKMLNPPKTKNGLVEENGRLYYYVNGELNHAGLIYVDGYYYYIDSSCRAVVGTKTITAAWTNGLLPYGTYEFDKDGKMIQK